VKIISNDTIQLEKLYKTLNRNGQENMTLDKVPVENSMGFDVILNIDIDATQIIIELAKTYLEYRLIKGVFLQKPSGEKELIATEILEDIKELENLEIEKNSTLYIEYKER